MILSDNHIHSRFSSDSETNPEDIINAAINLNFNGLCFTEHHDIDFPPDQNPTMDFQLDTVSYFEEMTSLKEKYKDTIDIGIGVELGLMSKIADKVNAYANSYSFDFIIGSTHLINGIDPYYPHYYEGKTELQAYGEFFEATLENVLSTNSYDVYGHLDYVIRYGPNKADKYYFKDYADIFEAILKVIVENGKGIEINTGSLYKGLAFPHPKQEIIKLYKELGGEIITIGSDAHFSKHVGYGFDIAHDILLDCDFKYYTTFRDRKPTFHKL